MRRDFDKLKIVAIALMAAAMLVSLPVNHDWENALPPAMVTGALG